MKNMNKVFLVTLISLTTSSHVFGMGFLSKIGSCVKNTCSSIRDNSVSLARAIKTNPGKSAFVTVKLGFAGLGAVLAYEILNQKVTEKLGKLRTQRKTRDKWYVQVLDWHWPAIGLGFTAGVAFAPLVKKAVKNYALPGLKHLLIS